MNTIDVVEFVRPNGEQRPQALEVSAEVSAKGAQIIEAGFRFTAEECGAFATFCIDDPKEGIDIVSEIIRSSAEVRRTVEAAITAFDLEKWTAEKEAGYKNTFNAEDPTDEL